MIRQSQLGQLGHNVLAAGISLFDILKKKKKKKKKKRLV
jgi:hypothetical protein